MGDNKSSMWPGWETGTCLGKGGFGTVYEIYREDFGYVERKALKIITIPKDESEVEYMRVEGMNEESITNTFYNKVADIIREYRIMEQLQDNPNIVHCDDFRYTRHEDGLGWDIYIKMELLTPLLKAMDSVKTEADIIRLGMDLCNALQACQEHNLIHRDIKPQNIFLTSKGTFKLGDFGISRTMEHTTMATVGIGTHSFMAPEVARGEKYNQTVDIYSLGLVLYWLLNEYRGPFVPLPPQTPTYAENDKAKMRRFSGEKLPRPKNGSSELTTVVLKACSFRSEDRYQSANEMLEALKSLETTLKQHSIDDEETIIDASFTSRISRDTVAEKKQKEKVDRDQYNQRLQHQKEDEEKQRREWARWEEDKKRIEEQEKRKIYIVGVCVSALLVLCLLLSIGIDKQNNGSKPLETKSKNNRPLETSAINMDVSEPKITPTVHSHTWVEATCTTPKKCSDCGEVSGNKLGHRWSEATYNNPQTCKVCGTTEGSKKTPSSALGLRDIVSSVRASSVYSGDNLGKHSPEKMYDGKLNTNWTENASGNGVGENVTFYFDDIYAVKKFRIYIGSHYNEGVYRQNCRPKVIKLSFSDGSTEQIYLEDSYDEQVITFDRYYYTDSVKLTIEDVYAGTKYLDTVIAELDFAAYMP